MESRKAHNMGAAFTEFRAKIDQLSWPKEIPLHVVTSTLAILPQHHDMWVPVRLPYLPLLAMLVW